MKNKTSTWGHYVPQLYIRKFGLNKKQTARLDKKTGEKKVVPIESFCAEKDYFSFDDESLSNIPQHLRWIHKDLVENYLATFIEGPIDTILCKIIKDRSLTSVSNQEILMLLEWAAWLFIANPTSLAIKSINNITSKFRKIDYLKLCSAERQGDLTKFI